MNKIFNKPYFNKIIFIFIVGFISRVLVNYIYDVNVFLDYLNVVSLIYYIIMSIFICLIHEIIYFFNINIIPSFSIINELCNIIIYIFGFIIRILISLNTRIFYYKLEDIKISYVIKGVKYLFNRDKVTMDINQSYTSKYNNRTKIVDSKSIKDNSYVLEKNEKDGTKQNRGNTSERPRTSARREEVRIRREQAAWLAEQRLRSRSMRDGETNFDANTSSQTGSNRRSDEERRYLESLELPPILDDYYIPLVNNNPLLLEPYVVTDNPPVMEPSVTNFQNNSQSNNSQSNNSQGNNNNYTENKQINPKNITSNIQKN